MLNPMQQSEPSKQGIFMAADYSWNLWQSEKDGQQSWEDSFSYIDHNSPIASKGSRGLRDLAMNMRILNDGGIDGAHKDAEYDAVNKWWINNESVDYTGKLDVKGVLTELKGKLDGGTATSTDFSQALTVYTTLQRAAKNYRANPGDKNMFDQIEPWISYWDDLTASAIDYITAAKQALAGDTEAAKATYATAKAAFAKSDTHTIADYYQRNKPARGGLVIVRPTVQALDSFVKAKTSGSVTPTPSDATVNTNGVGAAAWHENVDPKAVIDGDDSTFFWMQSAGCDCVKANAALTVTYAEACKAKEFRFIQAEKGGDTIVNGKIEYQDADGTLDQDRRRERQPEADLHAGLRRDRQGRAHHQPYQTSKWWKVYDLSATKIDEPGTVTKDALNAKIAEAEKVDSTDWIKSSREARRRDCRRQGRRCRPGRHAGQGRRRRRRARIGDEGCRTVHGEDRRPAEGRARLQRRCHLHRGELQQVPVRVRRLRRRAGQRRRSGEGRWRGAGSGLHRREVRAALRPVRTRLRAARAERRRALRGQGLRVHQGQLCQVHRRV